MCSNTQCAPAFANFSLEGKDSIKIRREVNKTLAAELAEGTHGAAFADACFVDGRPRADDLEAMAASFPGLDDVDWEATAVDSGLDLGRWQSWHARHCDMCSELHISDDCYFKLLYHFMSSGFDPPDRPGADKHAAKASCRAYVDKWFDEEDACEAAFEKWVRQTEHLMSPQSSVEPLVFCPLLPVIRNKDKWLHERHGIPYKVRLCMDFKNGGLNDTYLDWPFRYLAFEDIPKVVHKGDWLATIDIASFYLKLPAGKKLRSVQWFQDPSVLCPLQS
jgi:hypothetical protein